jgi:hypothetical protein
MMLEKVLMLMMLEKVLVLNSTLKGGS